MAGVLAGFCEAGDIGTIPMPDRERALVMTSDAVPSPAVGFLEEPTRQADSIGAKLNERVSEVYRSFVIESFTMNPRGSSPRGFSPQTVRRVGLFRGPSMTASAR